MSTPTNEPSASLAALRVLRERWWMALLVTVAVVVVWVGLAATQTKQYEATSTLLQGQSQLQGLINPSAQASEDTTRDASTNVLLVRSVAVAQRVKRALRAPESPEELLDRVDAVAEPDADIITITVTDPSADRAKRLADAFADQFVAFRADADRRQIADGQDLVRRRLAALPQTATAERAQLEQTLQTINALSAVTTGGAQVVDRATVPTSAASPDLRRSALLALLLGLVLGLVLIYLIDLFDRRIKAGEDFEALYRLPALTTIPERPRDPATQRDRSLALEPFRILRSSLGTLERDRPIRVVLVTSAVPGEGKSTTAAGLARAAALSGQQVVLVEVDLRRPTFQDQFDLAGDPRGLTTALIGGTPVDTLARQVLPGLTTLRVLPSGPMPPNAAELLRSPQMGRVLDDLAATADLIVLDAPPLLPVADSQVLLDRPEIDAVLITARAYHTTREEVRRTRAVLDRFPGARAGLVVNGVRVLDAGYDYYGSGQSGTGRRVPV
ncbi:polysaccharide biosynthesis tyrosine autokinase [Paraconexibacter algicola]|uniref:Uncharacterized protein n=1 Tax=Paraconexibacter algicola TaxID=2133960 RepID=A0A2T4UGW2_9ACTN|nr:polysaccharide biosynthesis tyrosine autokinase [Paraconexibacter algicola]PTL58482.1 hypothetical protein C7Y72_01835 [Paraconexibacter algicola]